MGWDNDGLEKNNEKFWGIYLVGWGEMFIFAGDNFFINVKTKEL